MEEKYHESDQLDRSDRIYRLPGIYDRRRTVLLPAQQGRRREGILPGRPEDGLFFFLRSKGAGEKEYFLGGRKMGPWVSALSAGASDMSAWVLMGLPTSIYAAGLGQVWIAIGLAIGYALSWLFEAKRLRAFSIVSDDAITIPQYLTRRFKSKSYALQVVCAVIFLIAYTIYAASSIKAAGRLFNQVIGIDTNIAMYLAAAIIIAYTFLGGFSAVCWTDFFQGLLMLGALLLAPLFALNLMNITPEAIAAETPAFYNPITSWQDIASGLGWGLGYFGMPHIIIRFLSLRSQKDIKKSAGIGITWTTLILIFAALVGIFGRQMMAYDAQMVKDEAVFINMVRQMFPAVSVQAYCPEQQGQQPRNALDRPDGGHHHCGHCPGDRIRSRRKVHYGPGCQRVGRVRRCVWPGHPAEPVLEAHELPRRTNGYRCRRGGGYRLAGFPFRYRTVRDHPRFRGRPDCGGCGFPGDEEALQGSGRAVRSRRPLRGSGTGISRTDSRENMKPRGAEFPLPCFCGRKQKKCIPAICFFYLYDYDG